MLAATLRRLAATLLAAGVASGCPALLEDDFEVVDDPAATGGVGQDASVGGGGAGDSNTGGINQGGNASGGTVAQAGASNGGAGGSLACELCTESCCDALCVNIENDRTNCGSCGRGCPGTACVGGECTNTCIAGFLNCDMNVASGCEVDATTDPENCGSCGIGCPFGASCELGNCKCPDGTANCDGLADNGCEVDISSDRNNCGGCEISCGANQLCSAGVCECATGFADCNGESQDGCETSLSSVSTCGSCTNDCGPNSVCLANLSCACADGFLDCTSAEGCESSALDPATCGSCTAEACVSPEVCSATGCTTACSDTVCGASCVDTSTSSLHCGECNNTVGKNQECVNGEPTCSTGFGDCDSDTGNGCETDLTSDGLNCGSCGNRCKTGAVCTNGSCSCAPGTPNDCGSFCAECCSETQCSDGDPCTKDTCGQGNTCSSTSGCESGTVCCSQSGCFECCSDEQCGSGEVCSGNKCVTPGCTDPEVLCDGSCINPSTNTQNCGSCGNDCGAGRSCSEGTCTPKWVTMASPPNGFVARNKAAYVWTGTHVFIWGGQDAAGNALDTGALYNPATDQWSLVSTTADTPSPRILATAVWTGEEVIVWGGGSASSNSDYSDGARYDPDTHTWTPLTQTDAPSARRMPLGIWTGSRALFFAGTTGTGSLVTDVDLYSPTNDQWDRGSEGPRVRYPTTGWSGSNLWVFAGQAYPGASNTNALYRYRFSEDAWTTLDAEGSVPSKRNSAFGGWDGSFLIAWSGMTGTGNPELLHDGARYGASANQWTSVTTTSAPTERAARRRESGFSARISGGRLLILGGFDLPVETNSVKKDGATYNSATNTWESVSPWPSGESRLWPVAVWAGTEYILWSGGNPTTPTSTGERYRP